MVLRLPLRLFTYYRYVDSVSFKHIWLGIILKIGSGQLLAGALYLGQSVASCDVNFISRLDFGVSSFFKSLADYVVSNAIAFERFG